MIGSLETLLIVLSSLSDLGSTQANRRRADLPLEPDNAIFMTIDTNSEMLVFIPLPNAVVSILSRKTGKPLPRWVHRRSRGEGQYGRLSCGTSDIQSAFCEPGRSTIKIINIFLQFQFWCIGRPVWDFYKKGSHTNITLYPTPALLPPCHWVISAV